MIAVCVVVAQRRQPGTPLTWGEAFVAAVYMFGLMMLVYGIVPNQWLLYADTELQWRKDAFFDPFGKGGLFPWERGQITFPKEALRDIIATGIYGVALVAHAKAWLWWQRRGQAKPSTDLDTSAFGRPLVRKA